MFYMIVAFVVGFPCSVGILFNSVLQVFVSTFVSNVITQHKSFFTLRLRLLLHKNFYQSWIPLRAIFYSLRTQVSYHYSDTKSIGVASTNLLTPYPAANIRNIAAV